MLRKHAGKWLGCLGPILTKNSTVTHPEDYGRNVPNYHYRFARGFLDTLHIMRLTLSLARALRDGPQVRLLRELAIDCFTNGEDEEDEEAADDDGKDRIVDADGREIAYYRPLALC